jgi:hypothetical protein
MLKIYEAFPGLDMEWLMTGKGNEPHSNNSASISSPLLENTLFSEPVKEKEVSDFVSEDSVRMNTEPTKKVALKAETIVSQPRERRIKKNVQRSVYNATEGDVQRKQIKEIRVYYTDGTYEVLMPER